MFSSINKQISVTSGACLGAAVAVMILVGVLLSRSLFTDTSASLENYSREMISQSLKRIKSDIRQLETVISDTVRIAKDMAATQEYWLNTGLMESISREQVSFYARYMLIQNDRLLGTYITWEPNVIDGNDRSFINIGGHSDYNGQFGPYWTRASSGTLDVKPVEFDSAYGGTTPNARGVRPGEWFLCTQETMAPCVSDPAAWNVQGKMTLMTSITAPVVKDGQFIGLAGGDISMASFQKLVQQVNESIYQGAGHMQVLSYHGSIVADTLNPDQLGKPLADEKWRKLEDGVKAGKEVINFKQDMIEIVLPLRFNHVSHPWAITLQLPVEVAMREAEQMNADMADSFSNNLFIQLVAGVLVAVIGYLVVLYSANKVSSPVRKASRLVTELSESEGDLTRRINLNIKNEVGTLASGLNSFLAKTHDIVKDTCASLDQLRESASTNTEFSTKTSESVGNQELQLEQVSSAVMEMTSASAEVARHCSDTAQSAESALGMVKDCFRDLDEAVTSLKELSANMQQASVQVDELESATQGISGIVGVITAISEQTNLLALNAAIEAARAGEQGRGFAVVADEVRNLATRTNESTTEINQLIETLTRNSGSAVMAMRKGAQLCEENVTRASSSQQQLKTVVTTTESISGASMTIATAVEEQNAVASEISRNINNIKNDVHQVKEIAVATNDESVKIRDVANQLEVKLNKFKY